MTRQTTLQEWAGIPIKLRTRLFHRQFPDRSISATKLSKIYKAHHITKKSVRMGKEPSNSALTDYVEKLRTLQDEVREAIRAEMPIVF